MHNDEAQLFGSAKINLYNYLLWIQSLGIYSVLFIACQTKILGQLEKQALAMSQSLSLN